MIKVHLVFEYEYQNLLPDMGLKRVVGVYHVREATEKRVAELNTSPSVSYYVIQSFANDGIKYVRACGDVFYNIRSLCSSTH